jgi:hypothetical protein
MKEEDARLLARHVAMDGDDVDAVPRNDFRTLCSSDSSVAMSPSITARSAEPARAAQVLTPIALPIACPDILALRPMTSL